MESSREPQQTEGAHLNDEELEFKPIVKYTAIGLAVVALLGVEYATYRLGVSHGFNDGVTSGVVSEAVNNAAVANLTHFMQAATASEATLLQMAKNPGSQLGWIKNPVVRREAEWTIASALMDRNKVAEAAALLQTLFPSSESNELWARRAVLVARAFADAGDNKSAAKYFRYAAQVYGHANMASQQLRAYSELTELVATASSSPQQQLVNLEKLQAEFARLGARGKALQSHMLAYMGRIHRSLGNQQAALSCFEKALSGAQLDKVPALAGAAVCMGSALLEKGDVAHAEPLLRDGVNRLGENPGDAPYLASALRDLARIEQERGNPDSALALLYRAEAVAMERVEAGQAYWSYLYDQRGWVHFSKESWESALADFKRALAVANVPEAMKAQPLEGAGRCCAALGQAEEAVAFLQEAVLVRSRHFAADAPALGRVYLTLAQSYDMAGKAREAAATYGLAAQNLPKEHGEQSDIVCAILGQAYALSQLQDWGKAIIAWDALRPLLDKGSTRACEVEEQFQYCRRHGASLPEEVDADEGELVETDTP